MFELPKEVWVIAGPYSLCPPADQDGTKGFMAWPSQEEAERGLRYQIAIYNMGEEDEDFRVIRLFPPEE